MSISKILLNGICTSKAIRGKSPKRMSGRNKSPAQFKPQKAPLFASLPTNAVDLSTALFLLSLQPLMLGYAVDGDKWDEDGCAFDVGLELRIVAVDLCLAQL